MIVVRFFRVAFLVVLTTTVFSRKIAMAAEISDVDRQALEGMKLSEDDAKQLEETLKHTPEDLTIRAKLLGYYSNRRLRSEWIDGIREREVLWLIEHHPEARLAGLPYAQFDSILHPLSYRAGATLWKQEVAIHTNEAAVLHNAANYFLLSDRPFAEELFKKGAALEPQNADWPSALGQLYYLGAVGEGPIGVKRAAAAALAEFERAYTLTPEAYKSYMLKDLTKSAFDAGETSKARMYAEQTLQAAQSGKKDWNLGNDIFFGNLILGRLALKAGDVEQAKHYLIESGKTPGSPQLDSFGPNMTLAKELLEKGEKDVVLEFFDLCAKFWKYQPRLAEWIATVKAGAIPDFGANLVY
jgi:tetratricopeptide (TPR) repeat protein